MGRDHVRCSADFTACDLVEGLTLSAGYGSFWRRMVQLEGETSNSLFEILEDWNDQLKPFEEEIRSLSNDL